MPRSEAQATAAQLMAAFALRTFTSREASDAGIAYHRLRTTVRAGLVHRLRRDHFRVASTGAEDSRLADCLERLAGDGIDACAGNRTAASIWSSPIWTEEPPGAPTVLVPRSAPVGKGLRGGVVIKRCDVDPRRVVLGPGSVPVTDPLLTAAHLAAAPRTSFARVIVLLSGGQRRELARSVPDLTALTHRASQTRVRAGLARDLMDAITHADVRGLHRVAAAARFADPRLETVLESISWARFVEAGIALPDPQVWVTGASGRAWRVDFLFGGRVIGEADGAVKYAETDSLWREKKRQADLEAAGYIVVRWTWEEIVHRPQVVLARIALALAMAA
jgi:hypothetical protein